MTIKTGDTLTACGTEYHVTRVGPQGIYGHATNHCDEVGCSGSELYLSNLATGQTTWGYECIEHKQH